MEKNAKKGPNRIKDSNVYWTTSPQDAVKIRMGTEGKGALEPISVPGLFQKTVDQIPDRPALATRDPSGLWSQVSYREYLDKSQHMAKVFIKLGLEARNSVGILAFNCPEWFYSSMAAIQANGISAGIYTTNSSEAVYHVLENAQANIVVVDELKQMEKIQEIRHKLPLLKAAIQISGPFDESLKEEDGYYKWSALEKMDVKDQDSELDKRLGDIAINECCCLIYTSGTTGMPKGVMLSHDNILWDAKVSVERMVDMEFGNESIISYLPLSHVAAMNGDIFVSLTIGTTVYFADKNALKGTLVKTLAEVHPTIFGGVPRVYEKIQEKMTSMEAEMGFVKRSLLNWAKSCTYEYRMNVLQGKEDEGLQYRLARTLVINKVRRAMGLDRCKAVYCGAAPTSLETKKFFSSLGYHILEIYGLSENVGSHAISMLQAPNLVNVGKAIEGMETKIINPDEQGHGEICLRGRHVFMGYLDDLDKSLEALDKDGWMHTGDLGYIDKDGFIYLTGRLKELIITAGGENIPPTRVESLVRRELSVLGTCFLVGDRRKFLTMLVTIKTEMDLDTGAPLDDLYPETLQWLSSLDLPYKTLSEILKAGPCPKVMEEIRLAINRANLNAISNAQRVQKFAILPHEFSIPTGELGPTLKVKRNIVNEMYADIIDGLYKD